MSVANLRVVRGAEEGHPETKIHHPRSRLSPPPSIHPAPPTGARVGTANSTNTRGVTLIELLVVVVILAILVAMLFPVARRVIHSSQQTVCAANLRELGVAAQQYFADNDGWFFTNGRMNLLEPYIGPAKFRKSLVSCPAVNALPGIQFNSGIYGMNYVFLNSIDNWVNGQPSGKPPDTWPLRLLNVPKPQKAWLFTEAGRCLASGSFDVAPLGYIAPGNIDTKPGPGVHTLLWPHPEGRKNFVFLDGHVESLSWAEVKARISTFPGQEYMEFYGLTGNR